MQTRTLCLFFSDLVGSTALKATRGDTEASLLIAKHKRRAREIAAAEGGREVDNAGDGFFMTFEGASAAVRTALRLQRFHGESPDLPAVRIGLHVGEVVETPSTSGSKPVDVEGLAVDLAARVQSVAEPGQVLMSAGVANSARQFVREVDGDEVVWLVHGQWTLKGFDTIPVTLVEAGFRGVSPLVPPSGAGGKGAPTDAVRVDLDLAEAAARAASERYVASLVSDGTHPGDRLVPRRKITEQLGVFLAGTPPAVLVLGASGSGKTTFVASLVANPPEGWSVVALAAGGLPSSGREAIGAIATVFALPGERALEGLERLADLAEKFGKRWLLVIDGLDRHPTPAAVLEGVRLIASRWRGRSGMKVLATATLGVWDAWRREGAVVEPELFFVPNDGRGGEAVPGVVLGGFDDDELAAAWTAYFGDVAAGTPVEALTDDARRALAHPVLLRIAADVYRGRPLPPRPFGGALLLEFANRRIFSHPGRADAVAALVDEMLDTGRRRVPMSRLWEHPRLRSAVIDASNRSPVRQLVDEQVLTWTRESVADDLPLPGEEGLEIAFEALLEYLLVWRLAARRGAPGEGIFGLPVASGGPPMLRGASVRALSWWLRADRIEPLAELLGRAAGDAWCADVASDALTERFEELVGDPAGAEALARRLGELAGDSAREAIVRVGDRGWARGRWPMARAALGGALSSPNLSRLDGVAITTRLSALCKSLDRWEESRAHAERALEDLRDGDPPVVRSRVLINLGSALYDLGDRARAAQCFNDAYALAERSGAAAEIASAADDLGVQALYADKLEDAGRYLARGRVAAGDRVLAAYLDTNLGLVALTRAIVDKSALKTAKSRFDAALGRFREAGHLQGISYAATNSGVVAALGGDAEAGERGFRETIRIADRLGERWTAYGARCNLGWLRLAAGDPAGAVEIVTDVLASAEATGDPKGIGDASLVLARAALDRGDADGVQLAADALTQACEKFDALGQRLGAALSCYGLAEVAERRGKKPASWLEKGDVRRAATEMPGLPRRLVALPWHMLLLVEVFPEA